jgi:hypothetical protein
VVSLHVMIYVVYLESTCIKNDAIFCNRKTKGKEQKIECKSPFIIDIKTLKR